MFTKMQYLLTCLVILIILLQCGELHCQDDSDWIEPNAWGRDHELSISDLNIDLNSQCSERVPSEEAATFIYLKKFISNLFHRNKLQYDKSSNNYERALLFTITSDQLEKLEQSNDPRDLDTVLTEIFTNIRMLDTYSSSEGMGIVALIWDIVKDLLQLLKISEVRFLLMAACVIVIGWFIKNHYGFGTLGMIFGGLVLYGYFHTYLECNRRMEAEQMLKLLESDREKPFNSGWWSIWNIFRSSTSESLRNAQYIEKASKINLTICRPDHVLIIYINELFLKNMEFFLEICTSKLISMRENLPFPYNYLAAVCMTFMIAYIIKLTFKYILSPRAWASLCHYPKFNNYQHGDSLPLPSSSSGGPAIMEDRISGENLKLLLNAICTTNVEVQNDNVEVVSVSSVQEIFDAIECDASECSSLPNTSSDADNVHTNNASGSNSSSKIDSDLEKSTVVPSDVTEDIEFD